MHVTVLDPPDPVVTWPDACAHLRLDEDDDEQALVEGYIAAATAWIDGPGGWLGRSIGLQTLEARLDRFDPGCDIALPFGPVVSPITSITYLDATGAEQTLSPSAYTLTGDGKVALASGQAWPSTAATREAVRIQYQAGEEVVPPAVKQAVLLLIGHWHLNREAVNVGNIVSTMPLAVEALLSPLRSWRG